MTTEVGQFPLLLCLVLSLSIVQFLAGSPISNTTFPSLIVFGDSVVDTGNNNNIKTVVKVNYPPYGQDFIGRNPTGRFSDGKVPSDLIAQELGIKDLLPAYFNPSLQPHDLLTGVNFAFGGAGYDPLTSNFVHVLSLSDQLEMFKDYIKKVEQIVGFERTSKLLRETIYIVVAGSNDIINTYYEMPVRRSRAGDPSVPTTYASTFVQDIYKLGARRVGVFGLPPLGCLPSQRTLKGGNERKCIDLYNQVAELFNSKILAEINSINFEYPMAGVTYIDIYNLPLDLVRAPQKYGFRISDKGCCGTGTIEVAYLCKYACTNVSEFVFWDSFHLTERAYRLLVHEILKNSINSFIF